MILSIRIFQKQVWHNQKKQPLTSRKELKWCDTGTFTLIGDSTSAKKAYRFVNSDIPPAIPLY
jgi:hypothetical protein